MIDTAQLGGRDHIGPAQGRKFEDADAGLTPKTGQRRLENAAGPHRRAAGDAQPQARVGPSRQLIRQQIGDGVDTQQRLVQAIEV
ncbi:MAG: hypothetical protein KGJ78_16665 [Alphaproteobacteria bacterium]|nr:hypothetical protein [Alphaproteobacteria bacterium]